MRTDTVRTATISRIDRSAGHDGPGVRTVVFFKGCPLRCEWCHSPETQTASPVVALHQERCIQCGSCLAACSNAAVTFVDGHYGVQRARCLACGDCADACPSGAREIVGRVVTVDDVMAEIDRDVVFYNHSGGGVTVSGGEPLLQAPFVEALLKRCRERRIATAVETCGMAPSGALLAVARWTDLFLFDLKLMDAVRHRRGTGRSNRQVLYNLRLLVSHHPDVRVRFPLVPGVNDDEENLSAMGLCLASLGVMRVDVLPYNRAGVAKYARLDRPCALPDLAAPSVMAVESTIAALTRFGLDVQVGGTRCMQGSSGSAS